jgi:very-short-patch-repair endonuclease
MGLRVLHISNEEVDADIYKTLAKIKIILKNPFTGY